MSPPNNFLSPSGPVHDPHFGEHFGELHLRDQSPAMSFTAASDSPAYVSEEGDFSPASASFSAPYVPDLTTFAGSFTRVRT
jgi:hypothetical protein